MIYSRTVHLFERMQQEIFCKYVNRVGTDKAYQFMEYSSIPVGYAVRGHVLLKLKVSGDLVWLSAKLQRLAGPSGPVKLRRNGAATTR